MLVLKPDAAVRRFSPAGKLLSTFGTLSATGAALQFATFNLAADAKVSWLQARGSWNQLLGSNCGTPSRLPPGC